MYDVNDDVMRPTIIIYTHYAGFHTGFYLRGDVEGLKACFHDTILQI